MKSSIRLLLPTVIALAANLPLTSMAQFEKFVITNTGLSLGLSDTNGQWSYYLLSLSSQADGTITGGGTRSDILAGPNNIAPAENVNVTVLDTARAAGPILSSTNSISTFTRRIGRQTVTLTNQVVADAAFLSIPLSDGGLIKGAFVYNYSRSQTAKASKSGIIYGWKTNEVWYGGQVFGSYNGMMGSTFLGE
jgi:hypothetical protein